MQELVTILKNESIDRILLAAGVFIACILLTNYTLKLVSNLLKRANYIPIALHASVKMLLRIVFYALTILLVMGILDIPVTSFVALFSLIGLAISLAVQGILKNAVGGIIILASKPFVTGDFIETDSVIGTVQEIYWLYTYLLCPDGRRVCIPNDMLYSGKLINYSVEGKRRVEIAVDVSYENSPDEVRAAVLKAAGKVKGVLKTPAPSLQLDHFGDSAVHYLIWVWTEFRDYLDVLYGLNEEIYHVFRENGVEFSYPHTNVHLMDGGRNARSQRGEQAS